MKQIVYEGKLLLSKAERDTKRADMNRCGVWDDVQEAHVHVSFLHDETAALLKAKFILDDKLDAVVQLVTQKKEFFKAYKGGYRYYLPLFIFGCSTFYTSYLSWLGCQSNPNPNTDPKH